MLGLEIRASAEPPWYFEIRAPKITLGREADCDVLLASPYVSQHHAEIRKVKDHYVLQDGESTNGTLLNGERLEKGKRGRLHNGDEIRIDEFVIGFIDLPGVVRTLLRSVRLPDALLVDEASREVWIGDRKLAAPLPLEVFRLLVYLFKHRGEFCTADELGAHIWGSERIGDIQVPQYDLNMLHQLISRLRKLVETPSGFKYIRNVRGHGYSLSERPLQTPGRQG